MSAAQSTLLAFSESSWEYVDAPIEGDEYWRCPDCRQPLKANFWPCETDDVDHVTGIGCRRCLVVVPYEAEERDLPHDATTVTLHSGEEKLVMAEKDAPEYIDPVGESQ